jgi:hypothetical protein
MSAKSASGVDPECIDHLRRNGYRLRGTVDCPNRAVDDGSAVLLIDFSKPAMSRAMDRPR